jgi:Lrp/AsnC family leucine-responsive transcriptional regulator
MNDDDTFDGAVLYGEARPEVASELDGVDRAILDALQENARVTNAAIARRVSMAPSAVLERIRKLERKGLIRGYEARLDAKALGHGLTAFTFVRSEETPGDTSAGELLARISEVMEVHHTAGHDCYLVKVRVADTDHLGRLLKEFGRIPSVRDTHTTVVLSTLKESARLPIPVDDDHLPGHEGPDTD